MDLHRHIKMVMLLGENMSLFRGDYHEYLTAGPSHALAKGLCILVYCLGKPCKPTFSGRGILSTSPLTTAPLHIQLSVHWVEKGSVFFFL